MATNAFKWWVSFANLRIQGNIRACTIKIQNVINVANALGAAKRRPGMRSLSCICRKLKMKWIDDSVNDSVRDSRDSSVDYWGNHSVDDSVGCSTNGSVDGSVDNSFDDRAVVRSMIQSVIRSIFGLIVRSTIRSMFRWNVRFVSLGLCLKVEPSFLWAVAFFTPTFGIKGTRCRNFARGWR